MAQDPRSLAASQHQRIDRICDRFEADWRAGKAPRIEDFLNQGQPAERDALLSNLLLLELELSGQKQAAQIAIEPTQSFYQRRFPQQAAVIERVFTQLGSQRASPSAETTRTYAPQGQAIETVSSGPRQIGRFQILEVLGSGAFGRVYRARDPQLDREVAIKVPLPGKQSSRDEQARLMREARAAATLHHPNICPVHEVGQEGDQPYIVMACIAGKPLSAFLKERKEPMPVKQAALITRKLALALEAAHAKGIVHRDLKPANIMFDRDRKDVVIMDFGMARRERSADARLTQMGDVLGTPAYMAPEQARGDIQAIGPKSDIYALGVILYEMLAGRMPFTGNVSEVLGQVLHVAPPPPSQFRPGLDPSLESICLYAMAKEPGQRFASMKEFANVLGDWLKGAGVDSAGVRVGAPLPALEPSPLAGLSAEQHRQTLTALEEGLRRSRRPFAWVLGGIGLLAALMIAGFFILVDRTTSVRVTLALEGLDLTDKALSYFLDERSISAEELARPIDLSVGEHTLRVLRREVEVSRYRFSVRGPETGEEASVRLVERRVVETISAPPPPKKADYDVERRVATLALKHGVKTLGIKRKVSDKIETVAKVEELPKEAFVITTLHVEGTIAPSLLDEVKELSSLREAALRSPTLTDSHVSTLASLTSLEDLELSSGGVSDASITSLKSLPRLEKLSLKDCSISDAAATTLQTFKSLKSLNLEATGVTDAALWALKDALPGCAITPLPAKTAKWAAPPLEAAAPKGPIAKLDFRGSGPHGVAISPDGRWLIAAGYHHHPTGWPEAGLVLCWDMNDLKAKPREFALRAAGKVAFHPLRDGKAAFGTAATGTPMVATIQLWDVVKWRDEINMQPRIALIPWLLQYSPNGKQILATWSGNESTSNSAAIFDADTGRHLAQFPTFAACFAPDDKGLFLPGEKTNDLDLIDWRSKNKLKTYRGHSSPIYSIACSSKYVAAGTSGPANAIRLWNAKTGEELQAFLGHENVVRTLAISPDQKRLLSGGDNTVRLWDIASGKLLETFTHDNIVMQVAFSPRGSRAISCATDQTIRLWQLPPE